MTVNLPYTGSQSTIKLRGQCGLVLSLEGSGEKQIAWEPEDRRVTDVEIRARVISCNAAFGQFPQFHYTVKLGHGEVVWTLPNPMLQVLSGERMRPWSLPARGMTLRLNARELYMPFTIGAPIAGPPVTKAAIQVSIHPVCGPRPLTNYQHFAQILGTTVQPFPMDATEWRVYGFDGLAVPPATIGIIPVGLCSAFGVLIDANALSDWKPIPHDAVGWKPGGACFASYR
jgi:hypothetical protein